MIFLQLFITFFLIGMFTVGGGYAMLSLIQTQVVGVHQWIDASSFTDIVAISQMTPGPIGINSATYIGYSVVRAAGGSELLGVLGSATATFAVVLPSFLVVLAICRAIARIKDNFTFHFVLKWLKPVTIGLIGAAAVMLITPDNFTDAASWIIFAAAFAVSMFTRVSPILVIILAGIAGFLIY